MAAAYVMASMNAGVKRVHFPPPAPPAKRTATGAPAGEGWVCANCGNHNFEGRIYCNLRSCGTPGPWACPACGNKNFANRDVCNKRTCSQPRPPPDAAVARMMPQSHQQAAVAQALSLLQASGLANIPGVQAGIKSIVASTGMAVPAPTPLGGYSPGGSITPRARPAAPKGAVMEGSWVCLGCGNINFPNRTTCNARTCGRPRLEVDGGPPKQGATDKSIFMPGSWLCAACENINWPKRETCGMTKCGKPRAEVDAGPPTPQHMQRLEMPPPAPVLPATKPVPQDRTPPEGSWNCTACGNLNYPNREACNARNCSKPRFE